MEFSHILLEGDEDEEEEEEGGKEETGEGKTCSSTHKCHGGHITGQCILADGHQGAHYCGWCASSF